MMRAAPVLFTVLVLAGCDMPEPDRAERLEWEARQQQENGRVAAEGAASGNATDH